MNYRIGYSSLNEQDVIYLLSNGLYKEVQILKEAFERKQTRARNLKCRVYLYLSLKRLNVIDNLIQHSSFTSDLIATGYQILQILHSLADLFPPHLHECHITK